jgi:hypothetical protein
MENSNGSPESLSRCRQCCTEHDSVIRNHKNISGLNSPSAPEWTKINKFASHILRSLSTQFSISDFALITIFRDSLQEYTAKCRRSRGFPNFLARRHKQASRPVALPQSNRSITASTPREQTTFPHIDTAPAGPKEDGEDSPLLTTTQPPTPPKNQAGLVSQRDPHFPLKISIDFCCNLSSAP